MPIPESHRPAVERALQTAFGVTAPDSAVALTGGLSGAQVLKIRVGGVVYLLRIEGPADPVRDPGRWYGCMRAAAEACLAPRIYYADAADGVAIMDFVPERSLSLDYAGSRDELITELAQAVRVLHELPPFPALMDYLDGMEMLIGQLRQAGIVPSEVLAPVLDRYGEVAALYRRLPRDEVSSHNDLNPRNILYDGRRLWLVDWESSFRADRYVDLATLANLFAQTPQDEALLARVYFGRAPDAAQTARLHLMRQINHVFYGVIFLNGAAAERPGSRLATLEAPALAEIHRRLGAGDFVLESWEGRATYGAARLNAALEGLIEFGA